MDYDNLLNLAVELGYRLMSSGAEIYRVEESVDRLLRAYGLEQPQVFAIPNCLIVSVTTPEGHPITRLRRIPNHGTDVELLERCNDLCRRLCSHPVALPEAQKEVEALGKDAKIYHPAQILLGYGLAPAFFTPLFNGSMMDGLCAFFVGLAVGLLSLYGRRFIGANSFFRTVILSAVASLLALFVVRFGIGHDVDAITIGVLMVLVPGTSLTKAMREIMAGDIISGISRMSEVILIATAIALGAGAGLSVDRFL